MKALVLEGVGRLVYKEVPTPHAGPGEVLLKVKACGICSSDFDRCLKTGTYHFPTIPGHEFSGQIMAVGDGVDGALVGRRVVVFPLLPDHTCNQCRIEAYARCQNYSYHGSRCDGAFAEYVVTPVWNVQTFADTLNYRVAALCEPAAVAYHAVRAANVCPGMRVCVVGTGTIGILAGLWAREYGAEVSYVCRNERKAEYLKTFGFSSFLTEASAGDGGFESILECVGTDVAIDSAVNAACAAGTVVLVGNPDGDKRLSRKTYWRILRNELVLKGVWNSSYAAHDNEWRKVLSAFEGRQEVFLPLITHTFSLASGLAAFDALREKGSFAIKGMYVDEL